MRVFCTTLVLLLATGCGGAVTLPETVAKEQPPTIAESRALPPVLVRRTPRSSGSIAGDDAGQLLAHHADQLAGCYDDAGGAQAGRGVVYLLIDINESGAVSRLTVGHSDVRSLRFETCLRQELSNIAFPRTSSPSTVQAHLVFGAEDIDDGRAMMRRYRASRAPTSARPRSTTARRADVRQRIQSCYERARRERPWLRGRMVLELTIDREGAVSNAAIADGDLDQQLSRCVLDAVENLRIEGEHTAAATLQFPVILD